MGDFKYPPEAWPEEARIETLENRHTQREITGEIERVLDIEEIDTPIGNTQPSKRGSVQILLAIPEGGE